MYLLRKVGICQGMRPVVQLTETYGNVGLVRQSTHQHTVLGRFGLVERKMTFQSSIFVHPVVMSCCAAGVKVKRIGRQITNRMQVYSSTEDSRSESHKAYRQCYSLLSTFRLELFNHAFVDSQSYNLPSKVHSRMIYSTSMDTVPV